MNIGKRQKVTWPTNQAYDNIQVCTTLLLDKGVTITRAQADRNYCAPVQASLASGKTNLGGVSTGGPTGLILSSSSSIRVTAT